MFIYRDKRTGRFASKKTWKRSKARGGKRYVRQGIVLPARGRKRVRRAVRLPVVRPRVEEIEEFEEIELVGGFDSPGRKKK